MANTCPTPTAEKKPCRGRVPPGRVYCLSHDPEKREAQREASRRGGESRSAARRAARSWAMTGEQIRQEDLPAILRACVLDVRLGKIEPSVASAIATLAKTSVQLRADLEMEQRLAALEQAAGITQGTGIRRVK